MPAHASLPKGRLLAIGGHEQRQNSDPTSGDRDRSADFILQRFGDELPARRTVVVIPTAAAEPAEAAQKYVEVFTRLGVESVEVLNVRSREQANGPETLAVLDRAAGVLFTGGDQLRLTALPGGSQGSLSK